MRRFFALIFVFISFFSTSAVVAANGSFYQWLQDVRSEAVQMSISQATLDQALPLDSQPLSIVLRLDRRQPEKTKSFDLYLKQALNQKRIDQARARFQSHRATLEKIGNLYGVEPQYIVALWGLETNFGARAGTFDIIQALATLAYDGRRSAFFRQELLKALQIIDQGHVPLDKMKGSWAGAMGQIQFMPSSFFNYAVDADGDGRKDIWQTPEDVFASAANYLAQSGWRKGGPVDQRVILPSSFDRHYIGIDKEASLQVWHDRGVRLPDGGAIPYQGDITASIIQPDGQGHSAYIVYNNYKTIMKWNKSVYFATSVAHLASKI